MTVLEAEAADGAEPEDVLDPSGEVPDLADPADGAPAVRWPERVALLVGAIGLGVAVIWTRHGVFTPDTRPDLYQQPGRFLASTVQAWVGGASGLGQGNFNAGAAPVAAVVWVIRSLGASPWLAVRIWRLLVLFLAAWGIRRYLGVLLGHRLTVAGRLLATVFFVVNPYVIVSGSTTPILLPYALLPWTMLAFTKATRNSRSWRWPALFALGFFAQTGLNAGVVPFFQLLALPAHLAHARWIEGRSWRELVRVVGRCGLLSVLVSIYWLLPSALASGTGAGIAASSEDPRDVARTSSYAETARLLGHWPLYGRSGDRLFLGGYAAYLTSAWVLVASFLVPVGVGLALWRSRARERLLVVVLLAVGLPVMVGLFPGQDPYPAGRLLGGIFDRVPAALAFRTTNKVGAIVVLAETVGLVIGVRAWQVRRRESGRILRGLGVLAVALLLVGISAPLWNGSLYPLGYEVPSTWHRALADLDTRDRDQRVLVVPGGTGGNYRWGMRSPDDLFPSLLDRPVAVRNTVTGLDDPAGNLMAGWDTALAQGALPPGALSTVARYLGASDVLARNDLLTEEIGGPSPALTMAQVNADPGLVPDRTYGRAGTDTVPGTSGPVTRKGRRLDPADAVQRPLATYRVTDPQPIITAASASQQLLVDGDGDAVVGLAGAGLIDGTQPLRLLGDLEADAFAEAVADGGRVVLTDTNRRRAWDTSRVANTTSPTLAADGDIDQGNGTTVTRWPDDPDRQTVTELTGAASVGSTKPGFGLHPFGRPSQAFDADPYTAWLTGGFGTGVGDSVWIDLGRPRTVRTIDLLVAPAGPGQVSAVSVQVGSTRVLQAIPTDGGPVRVSFEPIRTDRVEVTILQQTPGDNPIGISSVRIDDAAVREITRLPRTYVQRYEEADRATRDAVDALPLDVVLNRARGTVADANDDEEAQLDRRFELPSDRTFTFTASLSTTGADPALVAATRSIPVDERPCLPVVEVDGELVEARITSTATELVKGRVDLEGCGDLDLEAGAHEVLTVFGWRLDQLHLASEGRAPAGPVERAPEVTVDHRSATTVELTVPASAAGTRLLRLGEAYDARWQLEVDGEDAGPPIVVDGYSTGWRIDGDAHRLVVTFGPQRAVQATFVVSALALVGLTAIVVLPAPPGRRREDEVAEEPALDDEAGYP